MKSLAVVGGILLVGAFGTAEAICGGTGGDSQLNENQIRTELSGKRILATAPGGETWREDHCSVGSGNGPANLYKVGDGTPVDPRALRGQWQINTIAGKGGTVSTVTYTYYKNPPNPAAGPIFTWSLVRRAGGGSQPIDFCNGSTQIAVITSSASAGTCP